MSKYDRGVKRYNFNKFLKHHRLDEYYISCCICGWNRISIDYAHIIPDSQGGDYSINNIVPLCPNHHRLLDSNFLHDYESEMITQFIFRIYECLEKGLMKEY